MASNNKNNAIHSVMYNKKYEAEELNIGFVGNPNSGKTTLFNAYTGARLKVANWPGVTVEKKKVRLNITIIFTN